LYEFKKSGRLCKYDAFSIPMVLHIGTWRTRRAKTCLFGWVIREMEIRGGIICFVEIQQALAIGIANACCYSFKWSRDGIEPPTRGFSIFSAIVIVFVN
jgi:hypothetical protein